GVEGALFVVAGRAFPADAERVVADDRRAGGADGVGVRAKAAVDDDRGVGRASGCRQLHARREAGAAAVVRDVDGDAAAGHRAGDARGLGRLLAVDVPLRELADLGSAAAPVGLGGDA